MSDAKKKSTQEGGKYYCKWNAMITQAANITDGERGSVCTESELNTPVKMSHGSSAAFMDKRRKKEKPALSVYFWETMLKCWAPTQKGKRNGWRLWYNLLSIIFIYIFLSQLLNSFAVKWNPSQGLCELGINLFKATLGDL